MKSLSAFLSLTLLLQVATAFVNQPIATQSQTRRRQHYASTTSSLQAASSNNSPLQKGDPVMLVGPGFLQLVLARHLVLAGLKPIIVAPQKKLDSFFTNLLKTGPGDDLDGINKQLRDDSTIGMPEVGDPYFGELRGVVFCAEEAVLPPEFVQRVLDFTDQGQSAFADDAPARAICCLPVSNKQQKEKSNSWIPFFNNDKTQDETWKKFEESYKQHSSYQQPDGVGSIIRFGSLLGGSYDGPAWLKDYGIDEGMYKMSLEQYRDMRERAFDRYKLGAQVLAGDSINPKPNNQDEMEKQALKEYPNEVREAFSILGDYPEIDRSGRHTVAAGIVQALMMPATEMPKEITILSKAKSELPTAEEWKELFGNPSAAAWPDPNVWKPSDYGLTVDKETA